MEIRNITKDGDLDYFGSNILSPEENMVIWTNGFAGIIGIVGVGAGNPDWEVEAITDMREAIISDRFTPLESEAGAANHAVRIEIGMSAYLVANKSKSKSMRVNWRIIRP